MNSDSEPGVDAVYRRALALHRNGNLAQAWEGYRSAVQAQPNHANALHQLGVIALQTGDPERARQLIGQSLLVNPASVAAHINNGRAHCQLKLYREALASFDKAIALRADHAEAHNDKGIVLAALRRHAEAIGCFDRALTLRPQFPDAYNNRGIAQAALGRHEDAVVSYRRSIALQPDHAMAFNNLGVALAALQLHREALASYDKAVELNPTYADAYSNRGNTLHRLAEFEAAIASFDKALTLAPHHVDAHVNRGDVLRGMEQFESAIEAYDRAIAIDPTQPVAFNNRGIALGELKRYEAAVASFEGAIALKSDYAEAHNNRGNALSELLLYAAAVESFTRAIELDPGLSIAFANRANAWRKSKNYPAALADYETALRLEPRFKFLQGMHLYTRLLMCDWRDFDAHLQRLLQGVEADEPVCDPQSFFALSGSSALQSKVARRWAQEQAPVSDALPAIGKYAPHPKIRVGYFSADFREHAVAILTAQMFEMHDRSRFEVTAFSFAAPGEDAMRERLKRGFDRFIDVHRHSDQDIALLARSLQIDIAVDLGGYTQDCRPGIFARRAASLQVSYLGYPGTMGVSYMDYLIADQTLVPETSHYSEKIIYLPHSYMANDSQRRIAEKMYSREELGLPAQGFVFCCFNNSYKITPAVFEVWMRILRRVEGSVLWLSGASDSAVGNLRQEALKRQVAPQRIIFAQRLASLEEHLARHRAADLFIDTLPYNAHTTASDALWAGLPVLTCLGESFAGRVAGSLLNAVHLPELITTNLQQYEHTAVALAHAPARLTELRQRLAAQRLTAPLFDTRLFTAHLEEAYTEIHRRHQNDMRVEHLSIAPKV
jgi:predicted O-linked N-acetylglucosamine transferase (SPINDLY family)